VIWSWTILVVAICAGGVGLDALLNAKEVSPGRYAAALTLYILVCSVCIVYVGAREEKSRSEAGSREKRKAQL
jgi:hypothetical protein